MTVLQSNRKKSPYGMLAILMAGSFIAISNSTLLNIALPSMLGMGTKKGKREKCFLIHNQKNSRPIYCRMAVFCVLYGGLSPNTLL
jgi:hypothetical protein